MVIINPIRFDNEGGRFSFGFDEGEKRRLGCEAGIVCRLAADELTLSLGWTFDAGW
jgi:hypothetical protein